MSGAEAQSSGSFERRIAVEARAELERIQAERAPHEDALLALRERERNATAILDVVEPDRPDKRNARRPANRNAPQKPPFTPRPKTLEAGLALLQIAERPISAQALSEMPGAPSSTTVNAVLRTLREQGVVRRAGTGSSGAFLWDLMPEHEHEPARA